MTGSRFICTLALALGGSLVLASSARAQVGFNIDLDDPFAPPFAGGGVPSSGFGAAAGQAGFWNGLVDSGVPPMQLRDLSGQLTNVVVTGPVGGSGGGWNFQGNTGDYALLLNDGRDVSHDTWAFTNVPNGFYDVYTYTVFPDATHGYTSTVTVSNSITQNPQYVTGPMPGNRFILGVTHSIHEVYLTSGDFSITVDFNGSHGAVVNGFQIVPVPEPGTILCLGAGMLMIAARRPAANL